MAIDKKTINGNAALDFGTANLGIILPWVTSAKDVTNPTPGTMIYDTADKKVKYYEGGTTPSWVDMSLNSGNVDTSLQDDFTDVHDTGMIIGDKSGAPKGVLVFQTPTKGLLLPKVSNPANTISNPEAGTIVYDPTSKRVCVYNGLNWAYWGE